MLQCLTSHAHVNSSWIKSGLLTPDAEKHDTFLDIEPWTGSCMHAHQRLQINAQYKHLPFIKAFANLVPSGFYLPIAWADEWAYVPDDLAQQWKDSVSERVQIYQ